MNAKGPFQVTMHAEPPFDAADGVTLGRARFEKRFSGPLEATSEVHMLAARTPVETSAGYVALERVTGTLAGRRGSFVLQHSATMSRGAQSLAITVVPDSGTGDLRGLSGRMGIDIRADGAHVYDFEYDLGG